MYCRGGGFQSVRQSANWQQRDQTQETYRVKVKSIHRLVWIQQRIQKDRKSGNKFGAMEYVRSGERGRKSARAQVTDDQIYDLTGPHLHYGAIPRLIHFPGIAQHRPRQSVITTALFAHKHDDTRLIKRDGTNNANFRTVNLSAG